MKAPIQVVAIDQLQMSWASLRSQVAPPDDGMAPLPIRVVPSEKKPDAFEVVDGFKRVRAAREAGFREVSVVVEDARGPAAKALLLRANAPRRTLTPMDEARVLQSLLNEDGLTLTAAAKLLGKTRSWASKRHALVRDLTPSLQKAVDEARLPLSVAYPLCGFIEEQQLELGNAILRAGLSATNATALLSTYRSLETDPERQALLGDPLGVLHELSQARPEAALAFSSPTARKLDRYRRLSELLEEVQSDSLPQNILPGEARLLEAERKLLQAKIIACAQALRGVGPQDSSPQAPGPKPVPEEDPAHDPLPSSSGGACSPGPNDHGRGAPEAQVAAAPDQTPRTPAAPDPPERSPGTRPTQTTPFSAPVEPSLHGTEPADPTARPSHTEPSAATSPDGNHSQSPTPQGERNHGL